MPPSKESIVQWLWEGRSLELILGFAILYMSMFGSPPQNVQEVPGATVCDPGARMACTRSTTA